MRRLRKEPMKPIQLIRAVAVTSLLLSVVGCASIVDGGPRQVSIRTRPADAKATVYDKKGKAVACQQTPAVFMLNRGGPYSKARYRVVLEKPGYKPAEVEVKAVLNGWYFGNLVFGGLTGLVIVDPLTGAMWTLRPTDVERELEVQAPQAAEQTAAQVNEPK